MDRGRAGGFVTDNNLSMKQIKEKQFKEHLDRLEKIKKRRAGSSNTLDNNPPVIVKAALTNPRKIALRNEFNVVVEKENKSLLKRISMILTAPPTITTKDYYEMKKLCAPGTVDAKEAFENKLREDKTKKFFESIKHVKPVYSARQWEDDYKKQRFNQKFMRQVKYRRPKDFVDPFKPDELPSSAESPENNRSMRQSFNSRGGLSSRASNTSESFAMTDRSHGEEEGEPEQVSPRDADPAVKKSKSASHVDRIRAVKSQKNAPGPVQKGGKKQVSSSSSSTTLNLPRTKSESNNDDDGRRDESENGRDGDDDGVGYEQDFEDNSGGRGGGAAAVTVTLMEVDPYGTDDFEETDASAALAAAAAAGPRQQSSRGQRRPHSERRKSEEYEYDDGFEPVTEEEQRAIAVVVFAGDDEYSHDGFFGEETPAATSARRAEVEAVATEDEAPTDYEADGDFVEAPTDGQTRPAADQAAGAASEVDTDIDQPTASKAATRSSRERSNDTYRHKKKAAPKKAPSSDAPRPRPAEEAATPVPAAAPSSSEGHSSSGHRHSPPKHGKHSSRKAGSSSESREKHRHPHHAHHRDAAHSEAAGSSGGGSATTKDTKTKRPPRNDDDDYAGLMVEERRSSIVTIARPIKLMREVMAAHHPMALAASPTAAHAHNHAPSATTGNGSLTHKARDGFDLQVSYMDASIECCLINQETLLITVQGVNTEVPFQADAVISEQDLTTICDLPATEEDEAVETVRADNVDAALAKPARMILRDLDAVTSIATEIVENIELRMDYGSEPRIILNLIHEIDPEEGVQASSLVMHPAAGKGGAAGASSMAGGASAAGGFGFAGGPNSPGAQMVGGMPRTQSFAASATPFNIVADEDVEEILLSEKADVLVLTGGARLPLHFNVQNQSLAISNINKLIEYAKQQQRVEHVYVLYRAHVVNEEQLRVVATVTSSSVKTFKRAATATSSGGSASSGSGSGTTGGASSRDTQKPQLAVSPPQTLRFTMPLPSVVQLDPELFADFAANVVQSLKIEHDTRTGVNTLLMHSPA